MFVLLVNTACNAEVTASAATATPTPTPLIFITATLPSTQTPRPSPTPEPAPPTVPVAPVEGQTTSQLNVRNAPFADSNQVGRVDIFAKVQIVGKDPTSGWWMIVFPESPTGMGWITAQFVQVPDSSSVPVVDTTRQETEHTPVAGAVPTIVTGNMTVPSTIPTPILATALLDGDSAQSPAVNITLSASSLRSFNYSSDVSSPEGDPDDWVQFTLDGQPGQQTIVSVVLDCSGNSTLSLELIQSGVPLQSWGDIACGQLHQLQLYLFVGAPYSLQLFPAQGNVTLNYVAYTVTIQLTK